MENTRVEIEIIDGEKDDEQKPKQYKHFLSFTQEKVGGDFE